MRRRVALTAAVLAMLLARPSDAADPALTWDGLVLVPSTRLDMVYLQPGADFRAYTKVIVEPPEVAFAKDWQRNYNNASFSRELHVTDSQVQQTISEAIGAAGTIFADAWTAGGYAVVQAPGIDVMRVKTGVLNVSLHTPEVAGAGRVYSYAQEAGRATFYIEVRDSVTGALLGRAVDQSVVGDDLNTWRTSGSNRADFRRQVERWAEISVRGMTELKALSAVSQ